MRLLVAEFNRLRFPINRRHQGLATSIELMEQMAKVSGFPINRRHQGLATGLRKPPPKTQTGLFPINRRHQGLATTRGKWRRIELLWFPINRRHQGLATLITPRTVPTIDPQAVSNQ